MGCHDLRASCLSFIERIYRKCNAYQKASCCSFLKNFVCLKDAVSFLIKLLQALCWQSYKRPVYLYGDSVYTLTASVMIVKKSISI